MGLGCDLYFPLPEQRNKNKGKKKLELERFGDILNNLPYGDQERAACELFNILHRSNRIVFGTDERLTLLRQIEEPAFNILNGLQEMLKDLAAPIRRKEERIAKALVGTHFELALAYRCLLIKPPVKGMLRMVDHEVMANCIRLSTYHLGEVLRAKYSALNNPGGTIWRYIYSLFACAHKRDIHNLRLQALPWCRTDTVEDTFKSIVLLAISSPLTMRGSYFNSLYQLVPELTSYLELGQIRCGEGYTNLATFNLSATEPPKKQIMSGCEACGNASNCFTLSTEPLLNYIKQQLQLTEEDDQPTQLQNFLKEQHQLDGLLRNLGGAGNVDHSERIAGAEFSVEIVVGFNSVYQTLSQDMAEVTDGISEDILVEEAKKWTNSGMLESEQRCANCLVINQNSGGYCLYLDVDEKFRLRVGELAVVRESNNGGWRPAVISWVSGSKDRMDFGVKLLGNEAVPAIFRPIYNSGIDAAVNCLLLADDTNIGRPARIVTAPSDIAQGDTLLVRSENGDFKVSVSHIQAKTNGYAEYRCEWVDLEEAAATRADSVPVDGDLSETGLEHVTDFDSLWNKL